MTVLLLSAGTGVFAQQPVVAVAPFDVISNAVTAEQASMINDVFFVRLGNTRKVGLVNRSIVDRIMREHRFQAGDWSNENKTAELAKALNADWIVQGNIRKSGNYLLIIIQFYDIQTFKFEGGTDIRLANVDEAYDNMDPLVDKLVQTISGAGTRPPAAPARRIASTSLTVPDVVRQAVTTKVPQDALAGIGFSKQATINQSRVIASNRARLAIAQQMTTMVQDMVRDYVASSEVDPSAAIAFQENITRALSRSTLRGSMVVEQVQATDGSCWVVVSMSKADVFTEIRQCQAAAKLAVPAMASFNAEDRMEAYEYEKACKLDIPVKNND